MMDKLTFPAPPRRGGVFRWWNGRMGASDGVPEPLANRNRSEPTLCKTAVER
jgi:hypothetical protein